MKSLGLKQKGGQYEDCDYKLMHTLRYGQVTSVAVFPDGKKIVAGCRQNRVNIWKVETWEELLDIRPNDPPPPVNGGLVLREGREILVVNSVAVFPDGNRIVSAGGDLYGSYGSLKIWDATSGENLLTLAGHTGGVNCVDVFHDGSRIVSGGHDDTVRVWDAKTGENLLTLTANTGGVNRVAVFPDNTRIVSGGDDSFVKVWDANTGANLLTLTGHSDWLRDLAVFPDNSRIVSASRDGAKVWDATSGTKLLTLRGGPDGMKRVAVFPDNSGIVSVSFDENLDNSVKVWDATFGVNLLTMKSAHTRGVSSVAVFPDNSKILSGSWNYINGTINIWGEDKMVLTRKANGVVDKITLNDDILRMIKAKLPICRKELNRLQK